MVFNSVLTPPPPQQLDKDAKAEVDAAVEEAKKSPEPLLKDLWTDIYYKGTEPPYMRGREREEVSGGVSVLLFCPFSLWREILCLDGSRFRGRTSSSQLLPYDSVHATYFRSLPFFLLSFLRE
jgi:hypothetical protein